MQTARKPGKIVLAKNLAAGISGKVFTPCPALMMI
jgi:hypothetical protein